MDELTLEQAWQNVATAAAQFQGNQQQWGVLNASMAKVNEAITPREVIASTADEPASSNGQAIVAPVS